jgi:hypothetical protein
MPPLEGDLLNSCDPADIDTTIKAVYQSHIILCMRISITPLTRACHGEIEAAFVGAEVEADDDREEACDSGRYSASQARVSAGG